MKGLNLNNKEVLVGDMVKDGGCLYIVDAEYIETGVELTEDEIEELNYKYEAELSEEAASFCGMGMYDRSKGG